jgi:hypothetical protein
VKPFCFHEGREGWPINQVELDRRAKYIAVVKAKAKRKQTSKQKAKVLLFG